MRLFIGVELPPDVKAATATAAGSVRERLESAAPRSSIRWVEPANLHITLWFLGEVDEPRAEKLIAALDQPIPVKAFDVHLERFGTFPNGGSPRVFWIGIGSGTQELIDVHAQVTDRVVPLGFEPESRSYAPHLTVARVKEIRRSAVPGVRKLLAGTPIVADFRVASLTLFRSRLSPQGSRYESLMQVPLQT